MASATSGSKPSSHPKYSEMIAMAITALKERTGSSRQAILKYILASFEVNGNGVQARVNSTLKKMIENEELIQVCFCFVFLVNFYRFLCRSRLHSNWDQNLKRKKRQNQRNQKQKQRRKTA